MDDSGLLQELLAFLERQPASLGAVVLFFSASIEYVFPPFPGDLITLFGSYLVVSGHYSFWFVLLVVTAGSVAGAMLDYGIGRALRKRLLRRPRSEKPGRFSFLTREKYELVLARFRRWGYAAILLNRFMPGIRAFFFVAAGAAGMSFFWVSFLAALSALAFNALLLFAGWSVGANWERLSTWFHDYATITWIVLLLAALALVVVWLTKRLLRSRQGKHLPPEKDDHGPD